MCVIIQDSSNHKKPTFSKAHLMSYTHGHKLSQIKPMMTRITSMATVVHAPSAWVLFQTSSMASGHHGDSWTNKPAMCDDRVSSLSDH